MRSVKISVEGSFWDSQIYSNQFTLFGFDGSVHNIQWDAAIDFIAGQEKNISIQTAYRVAFSDGDLFYNPKVRKILKDPSISNVIKNQLNILSDLNFNVMLHDWKDFLISTNSPFDFLPTDTEIYYNTLFAGSDEGLFSSNSYNNSKIKKHFDGNVLKINASDRNTALAVAAGQEGLFEFSYNDEPTSILGQEHLLNSTPCSACEWAFQSVMGWSSEGAYLASFLEEKNRDNKRTRRFDRVINENEMFGIPTTNQYVYVWGSREKIYRVVDGNIEVTNYSPKPKKKNNKSKPQSGYYDTFTKDGEIKTPFLKPKDIIASGTAPFGTVIETEGEIIVLRSDGVVESFKGDIVHWRIFPRSEHYNNQLHIIFEEHIQIVSFVHDYFVNQDEKLAGFTKASARGYEDII